MDRLLQEVISGSGGENGSVRDPGMTEESNGRTSVPAFIGWNADAHENSNQRSSSGATIVNLDAGTWTRRKVGLG